MGASIRSEAQTIDDVEKVVRALLPSSWVLEFDREASLGDGARRADLLLRVVPPNGASALFLAEIKSEATGTALLSALAQLPAMVDLAPGSRPLFVAPWISPRSQQRLAGQDVSYIDATGNVRLVSDEPALVITAQGATKNPWPVDKALQSLRGPGAARAIRALVDFAPPYGVRELARRTNASPATLSRVIDLLQRDGLAERDDRGGVLRIDWAGAIRRWAQDYDVLRTNDAVSYLQPRGLSAITERLTESDLPYALTGSMAANKLAPFAPARIAMIYVSDVPKAADVLDLRETESGANVMLLRPFDDVTFARRITRDGLQLANPSQLAVDLLTGPGRAPAEGDELLAWMGENIHHRALSSIANPGRRAHPPSRGVR